MANLKQSLADFNDFRNSWKLAPLTSKLESPLAHLEDRIRNFCRHGKLAEKQTLCVNLLVVISLKLGLGDVFDTLPLN